MISILICIDDTDSIDSRGTGHLAALLSETLVERGWAECQPITRHQLLVHPDIPYTSHNSSMCFGADIQAEALETLVSFCQGFLEQESEPGSDPGLCVVDRERLVDPDALIAFGMKAKAVILEKAEAYQLAESLNVHLSEHGGTGIGVIGALAGCGLRLSGNDGRFRGHFPVDAKDGRLKVWELRAQTGVDSVESLDGVTLKREDIIQIGEKVKAIVKGGKSVLLVSAEPDAQSGEMGWQTCTKKQLKAY